MSVIKGAPVAEAMGEEIRQRVEVLKNDGIEPCLAIIRVGEDGSQMSYEKGAEIIDFIDELAVKGSVMAVSDVGVAAQFVRTAVLSASMNVYINTKSMKDKVLAAEYNEKADRLNRETAEKADRIFAKIEEGLKCQ